MPRKTGPDTKWYFVKECDKVRTFRGKKSGAKDTRKFVGEQKVSWISLFIWCACGCGAQGWIRFEFHLWPATSNRTFLSMHGKLDVAEFQPAFWKKWSTECFGWFQVVRKSTVYVSTFPTLSVLLHESVRLRKGPMGSIGSKMAS